MVAHLKKPYRSERDQQDFLDQKQIEGGCSQNNETKLHIALHKMHGDMSILVVWQSVCAK